MAKSKKRSRKKGRRALLFTDANFLAHVSRLLEIAKVLRADYGYEITFAGDGPYLDLARKEGFPTDWVVTVRKQTTLDLAKRATLVNPFWWNEIVEKSIESDVECILRNKPDLVLGDMHWTARAATLATGSPYVVIVNASWTNYFSHRIRAFDDHFLTRMVGTRLFETLIPTFRKYILGFWALPYRSWSKREVEGRLQAGNLLEVVEGDLTLLADIPEFCPTDNRPESMKYIGPLLWTPEMDTPPWLDELDPKRPLVYVSMGSTGKKEFFEKSLEAFSGTDYQVVMTTGEISMNGSRIPENFRVTDFAPGLPIMKRAEVVINHGGNGTIYQALTGGTPVIGIPTHIDQQIQLQLCEAAGVGRKLREKSFSAKILRNAVDEVVGDPSYKENANRMREAISTYDAPRTAAGHIEEFAAARTN